MIRKNMELPNDLNSDVTISYHINEIICKDHNYHYESFIVFLYKMCSNNDIYINFDYDTYVYDDINIFNNITQFKNRSDNNIISNVRYTNYESQYNDNIILLVTNYIIRMYCINTLFTKERSNKLFEIYLHMLDQINFDNMVIIKNISIVNDEEKNKLLDWGRNNDTGTFKITKKNYIHNVIDEYAAINPDKKAICTYDNVFCTYKTLNNIIKNIKHHILSKIKKGKIGILLKKDINTIPIMIGILSTGSTCIPMSDTQTDNWINDIFNEAEIDILITYKINNKHDCVNNFKNILYVEDIINNNTEYNIDIDINIDDTAYLIFTSGSTGKPKGVMITYSNLIHSIESWKNVKYFTEYNGIQYETFLFSTQISFISVIRNTLLPLYLNKTVFIINNLFEYNSNKTIDIDFMGGVCSILDNIDLKKYNYKMLLSGGEKITKKILDKFKIIINNYGSTECSSYVSQILYKGDDNNIIGKPHLYNNVYVLNKDLDLLPINFMGEIHVAGPCVSKGYFKMDDITKIKFIKNPFLNNILYKTGDIVRWDENGNLRIVDRNDNLIKINGNRVELDDINNQILKYNSDIIKKSVVHYIKNMKILNYYIILNDDIISDLSEVNSNYYSKVSEYKIKIFDNVRINCPNVYLPNYIIFMDEYPRLQSGKIDKNKLPLGSEEDNINYNPFKKNTVNDKPMTEREKNMVNIIYEITNTKMKIGLDTNFITDINMNSMHLIIYHSKLITEYPELGFKLKKPHDLYKINTINKILDKNNSIKLDIKSDVNEYCIKSEKYIEKYTTISHKNDNFFITGCSGYLGIYVLHYLMEMNKMNVSAKYYLLIRELNGKKPFDRFIDNINKYPKRINIDITKIIVIEGDMGKNLLGLTEESFNDLCNNIDVIIHIASDVNHNKYLEELEKQNINSLYELIKICTTYKLKRLNFISTFGIFSNYRNSNIAIADIFYYNDTNENKGYVQSKYICEHILNYVHNLIKININVFRPALISGDNEYGYYEKNGFVYNLIEELIRHKIYLDDNKIFISPINMISKIIASKCLLNDTEKINFYNTVLNKQFNFIFLKNIDDKFIKFTYDEFVKYAKHNNIEKLIRYNYFEYNGKRKHYIEKIDSSNLYDYSDYFNNFEPLDEMKASLLKIYYDIYHFC